ncbi:CorA family divalent cation transporter [Lysobacter sp. P5_B9]
MNPSTLPPALESMAGVVANPAMADAGRTPDDGGAVHAVLFDADGTDREVAVERIDLEALAERQLLWIDVRGEQAAACLEKLGLAAAVRCLEEGNGKPRLQNFGEWFVVQVVAVADATRMEFPGQAITLIVGRNFVVTVHREPLAYLEQLLDRERADTRLGVLSAESFTASVLDWQMTTYFDAVAALESEVDHLEVELLTRPIHREHVPELAVLRRAASRLRQLLAPHRIVYSAMARPDFRPDAGEDVEALLRGLNERFERVMEAVEAARELVIGSFELFATRTAQRTNETMRVLTFVTVLLGTLAVLAGVLGMNFDAPIFRSGERGFLITIALMVALVITALVAGRWRRWW